MLIANPTVGIQARLELFQRIPGARSFLSAVWLPDKDRIIPVLWYVAPEGGKQSRTLAVEFLLAVPRSGPASVEATNYWLYEVDRGTSPPSTVQASVLEGSVFWDAVGKLAGGQAVQSIPSTQDFTVELVPDTDLWEVVFGTQNGSKASEKP